MTVSPTAICNLERAAAIDQPLVPAAVVEGARHSAELAPRPVWAGAARDHLRGRAACRLTDAFPRRVAVLARRAEEEVPGRVRLR